MAVFHAIACYCGLYVLHLESMLMLYFAIADWPVAKVGVEGSNPFARSSSTEGSGRRLLPGHADRLGRALYANSPQARRSSELQQLRSLGTRGVAAPHGSASRLLRECVALRDHVFTPGARSLAFVKGADHAGAEAVATKHRLLRALQSPLRAAAPTIVALTRRRARRHRRSRNGHRSPNDANKRSRRGPAPLSDQKWKPTVPRRLCQRKLSSLRVRTVPAVFGASTNGFVAGAEPRVA